MRYPNGKIYRASPTQGAAAKARATRFGKRGMRLEEMLNASNEWYRLKQQAVIHKKPTPIQVVGVDYPARSKARITEAYYRQSSTTDYNGVYQGHYLDFEAKQTKQKTRFPLSNFHAHQIEHMAACVKQGGICFAIILFSLHDEAYLYPFEALIEDWEAFSRGGSASIPYERIKSQQLPIAFGVAPQLDYLKAVDRYIHLLNKNKGSERCE